MKEKWSEGTYIVPLQNKFLSRSGFVTAYKPYRIIPSTPSLPFIIDDDGNKVNFSTLHEESEVYHGIRWFETKEEAEEFAKTLIEDKKPQELTVFPSKGCCKFDKQIEDLLRKNHSLYESSKVFEISKVKFICWNSEKYWYSTEFSSKKQYPFEQLKKFFIKKEVKQPLKQAVHCTTQEQWDFVLSKLPTSCLLSKQSNKFVEYNTDYKHENGIAVDVEARAYCGIGWYKSEGYQILSFQEWCDLNGYKMEKEVEFEVGKWYKNLNKNSQKNTFGKFLNLRNNEKEFWMSECIYKGKFTNTQGWLDYSSETVEIDIKEIQQYLPDGHPDKIKSNDFKVGDWVVVVESKSRFPDINRAIGYIFQIRGDYSYYEDFMNGFDKAIDENNKYCINYNKSNIRHATPEEINNHLISIGQIPAGKPLNDGIEPNKDGMFKYTTVPGTSFGSNYSSAISYLNSSSKPKMILSIDDEELPMVNIIKTNSIKQLLNND